MPGFSGSRTRRGTTSTIRTRAKAGSRPRHSRVGHSGVQEWQSQEQPDFAIPEHLNTRSWGAAEQEPAVTGHAHTVDVGGVGRTEEGSKVSDIFGQPDAARWDRLYSAIV